MNAVLEQMRAIVVARMGEDGGVEGEAWEKRGRGSEKRGRDR